MATMLSSNVAAHRLFATISRRLQTTSSHGVDELSVELVA
jgi:hypothetical protein